MTTIDNELWQQLKKFYGVSNVSAYDYITTLIANREREARNQMLKYIDVDYIECNGWKCRLLWCGGCNGEEAEAVSVQYREEITQLTNPKGE